MSYDLIIFIIHATQIVFQGYEECSTVNAVHFKGRKYLPVIISLFLFTLPCSALNMIQSHDN